MPLRSLRPLTLPHYHAPVLLDCTRALSALSRGVLGTSIPFALRLQTAKSQYGGLPLLALPRRNLFALAPSALLSTASLGRGSATKICFPPLLLPPRLGSFADYLATVPAFSAR